MWKKLFKTKCGKNHKKNYIYIIIVFIHLLRKELDEMKLRKLVETEDIFNCLRNTYLKLEFQNNVSLEIYMKAI